MNVASIYVKLTPIEERKIAQQDLMVRARNEVLAKYQKLYPGQLRTSVQQVAAISGGGFRNADIQYVIGGPDLNKLQEYSDKLLAKMKTIPDVVDADSTLISGKPELRVEIDRARAADLGVRVGDIAQALNSLVAGQKVSTFNAGTDQYDVRVRSVGQYRTSVEGLQRMIVSSTKVGWVSLDNLVKVEEGTGPAAIDRLNRRRQVTILGNVRPGGSQAAVIQKMASLRKRSTSLRVIPWALPDVRRNSGAPDTISHSRSSCRSFSCTWCWRRSLNRSFTR